MKYLFIFLVLIPALFLASCGNMTNETSTAPAAGQSTTLLPTTEAQPFLMTSEEPAPPSTTGRPIPSGPKPAPPASQAMPPSPAKTKPPLTTTRIPSSPSTAPAKTGQPGEPLPVSGTLNLGIMVHLEGWNDGADQNKFQVHASKLREYASLFEKYGAKLTLESKEMTDGSIKWNDNILLEMEQHGHGIGVHADAGGNKNDTTAQMKAQLVQMKSQMESLNVEVRHVSGICSRCDWVTAAAEAGFEFVSGTVSFALASLPEKDQPITIPADARPSQFHEAYPFTLEGRLSSWRAESGLNWINDTSTGRIVIIPSGGGLAYAYEESQGASGLAGDQQFTVEDIPAFENTLKSILEYTSANKRSQPYTYYLSWSFGKSFDPVLLEAWLQMVDKYVDSGGVKWQTLPEMYDDYVRWEKASGRRS